MQAPHIKKSDKLHVVDFSTFTQQRSNQNVCGQLRKIRNAKYRKKQQSVEQEFNLLSYATVSRKVKGRNARRHYKKGATLILPKQTIKKRGKISEIRRKKLTRLKKSILKFRKSRQLQCDINPFEQNQVELKDFVDLIKSTQCETITDETTDTKPQTNAANADTTYVDKAATRCATNLENLCSLTDQLNGLTLHKPQIHSRRFRDYCDNCTSPKLAEFTKELLSNLNRFQRRAYSKNPIKANAHRRFVVGFREVQNNLRINKIKLVIIATDCEQCSAEGGIDETIVAIKADCKSLDIPYVFSLQRRELAYLLHKKGIVSCIGVLDYDGVREIFTQLLSALETARSDYANAAVR